MNFITDHIARKGTAHINCEDNALSFYNENLPFGIVSDGCSSEKDSQFISSLICNYYRKLLNPLYNSNVSLTPRGVEYTFMDWSIKNVFATIIYNSYSADNLKIVFIGDGAFFIKFKNKDLQWYIVEQNDFPLYPEYSFHRFQNKSSLSTDNINIKSNVQSGINDFKEILLYQSDSIRIEINKDYKVSNKFYGQIDFNIPLTQLNQNEIEFYGYCSDGINTFYDNETQIPAETILNELCSIKLKNENFLQRRFNIMSKKYKHSDDFSCVMFLNKD